MILRSWIERVPLTAPRGEPGFAGREGNQLDRIKAMKSAGWELTVLTVKGERYVLVLGWMPTDR